MFRSKEAPSIPDYHRRILFVVSYRERNSVLNGGWRRRRSLEMSYARTERTRWPVLYVQVRHGNCDTVERNGICCQALSSNDKPRAKVWAFDAIEAGNWKRLPATVRGELPAHHATLDDITIDMIRVYPRGFPLMKLTWTPFSYGLLRLGDILVS